MYRSRFRSAAPPLLLLLGRTSSLYTPTALGLSATARRGAKPGACSQARAEHKHESRLRAGAGTGRGPPPRVARAGDTAGMRGEGAAAHGRALDHEAMTPARPVILVV